MAQSCCPEQLRLPARGGVAPYEGDGQAQESEEESAPSDALQRFLHRHLLSSNVHGAILLVDSPYIGPALNKRVGRRPQVPIPNQQGLGAGVLRHAPIRLTAPEESRKAAVGYPGSSRSSIDALYGLVVARLGAADRGDHDPTSVFSLDAESCWKTSTASGR